VEYNPVLVDCGGPSALPLERTTLENQGMKELTAHPWKLTIESHEDDDHCEMVVHLDAGDRSLAGVGRSRRNPIDPSVPQIGEELAAARALHDLANHLTDDARVMIEEFAGNGD